MNTTGEWRKALSELEGPDLDPEDRHRLANVVRDEVEELERGLGAAATRGSEVLRKVVAPKGPRERSVVAWRRGTSLSFKADGPEDSAWFEELAADPPAAFRVRPSAAAVPKLKENPSKTWGQGIRASVLLIRVDPEAFQEEPTAAFKAAIEGADQRAEDWIIVGPRRRNVGGHTGRALIVTFSFMSMDRIPEEEPEEEPRGSIVDEDESEET